MSIVIIVVTVAAVMIVIERLGTGRKWPQVRGCFDVPSKRIHNLARRHLESGKPMKPLLVLLLLSLAVICTAQKDAGPPSAADFQLSLPKPLTTVNIVDDSPADAPIKCLGTADAYMMPISGDRVWIWVEANNLQIQNVSGNSTVRAAVRLLTTDVRGNQRSGILQLKPQVPGSVLRFMGAASRKIYSSTDYHLRPAIAPTAKAHVLSATFEDGSTWVNKAGCSFEARSKFTGCPH